MNNTVENGNTPMIISFILAGITWVTPSGVDLVFKGMTAVGTLVAVIFAVRYHIAAKKAEDAERKLREEELKRLKDAENKS